MLNHPLERSLYGIEAIEYRLDTKHNGTTYQYNDDPAHHYADEQINDMPIIDTPINDTPINDDLPQNNSHLTESRIMICSQYMLIREDINKNSIHTINKYELFGHILIWLIGSLVLVIPNLLMRIITIDGIIGCMGFYISSIGYTDSNNFFLKHRLRTLDRYIYYGILIGVYYCIVLCVWIPMWQSIEHLFMIGCVAQIMIYIYKHPIYFKIRTIIADEYNRLIRKIVCKQFAKIINMIIRNVLNTTHQIEYTDLTKYYNDGMLISIGDFTVQFIGACIFNYLDRGSLRLPFILYKNMFLKDRRYRIGNDQKYFEQIVIDRKWEKFMDMYTLNRMIRMLSNGNPNNNFMEQEVNLMVTNMTFIFNRLMFGWTMMSLAHSVVIGIMCNLLFVFNAIKKGRYIMATIIFSLLAQFSEEKLLTLILCNILYPLIESHIIPDILNDLLRRLKSLYLIVKQKTKNDTIYLCCLLVIHSLYDLSTSHLFGMGGIVAIIILCGIKISDQNNILVKIMLIMILSRISSFNSVHVMVMPILIQNIMDGIFPKNIQWYGFYRKILIRANKSCE